MRRAWLVAKEQGRGEVGTSVTPHESGVSSKAHIQLSFSERGDCKGPTKANFRIFPIVNHECLQSLPTPKKSRNQIFKKKKKLPRRVGHDAVVLKVEWRGVALRRVCGR